MKNTVRKLARGEQGAALILALVLLLVGGLITGGLLQHMGAGLLSGEVYARRTAELYAADAGVEDAVWKIEHQDQVVGGLPCTPSSPPFTYTIMDVNGKTVQVSIEYADEGNYRITSTAVTYDSGNTAAIDSSTAVEAYVEAMSFDLLSGALVSSSDIAFHKGCVVTGDVYYVGTVTGANYTLVDGEAIQVPLSVFPTAAQNEAFAQTFEDEALTGGTQGGTTLYSDTTLGPKYIDGSLNIDSEVTITLAGVVYVAGSIKCEKTLTITGTGSLVAEGDIYLSKLADYTVTGDSIIMSLNGDITLKKSDRVDELSINAFVYAPNGSITFDKDMTVIGSVIGAGIQIDKDGAFTYVSKSSSFKFPPVVTYGAAVKTYEISQS